MILIPVGDNRDGLMILTPVERLNVIRGQDLVGEIEITGQSHETGSFRRREMDL